MPRRINSKFRIQNSKCRVVLIQNSEFKIQNFAGWLLAINGVLIQNSEFKIQNFARWLLAKDHVVCVKSLCNRAVSTLYSLCENGVIALRLHRNRAAIFP